MAAFWRPEWREDGEQAGWECSIVFARFPGTSQLGLKRVSLAAMVAEVMSENPYVCSYQIDEFIWADLLTEQERGWLGDYKIRDISDTIRLVSRKWGAIQLEVDAAASLCGVTL
jgi:hypothetical protein